jgi:hypothetical protein
MHFFCDSEDEFGLLAGCAITGKNDGPSTTLSRISCGDPWR